MVSLHLFLIYSTSLMSSSLWFVWVVMFLCHIGNTLCYQHSLSGSAKVKPFDPKVTCKQECLITTFQEVYFVSESFEEAKEKMRYGIFFPPCYIKAGLTLPISQEQHQALLFLPKLYNYLSWCWNAEISICLVFYVLGGKDDELHNNYNHF